MTGAFAPHVSFLPRWPDNPYQELLADALRSLGARVEAHDRHVGFLARIPIRRRPSIVHVHAPDHFVVYSRSSLTAAGRLAALTTQLAALRLARVGLVWTAHDLLNHEGEYPRLDRAARSITARFADAIIVHCPTARDEISTVFRLRDTGKVHVIPHGHFIDRYPDTGESQPEARAALNLPAGGRLLLFLGNLREHKGLPDLIAAWPEIDRPDAHLVIAGQPFTPEVEGDVRARVSASRLPIEFRPGYVADALVSRYMRAADAVVLPFRRSLTSGSVVLAMSCGRACIAPRMGCTGDILDDRSAFLYAPGDVAGLLRAMRAALDAGDRLESMGREARTRIARHPWSDVAQMTMAVYRRVCGW